MLVEYRIVNLERKSLKR